MTIVKLAAWVIPLAVLVGSSGCGGSDSPGSGGTTDEQETVQPADVVVEFSHSYFSPSELTVSAGDTVIFRNVASMNHPLVNEDMELDTGQFDKGERSIGFDTAGAFTITNTAHGTTITVVVQDGGS